jgi:hypothetical protein
MLNTQEFNLIKERTDSFEKATKGLSDLQRSSAWIDAKRAIEAEMREISLASNSSGELWLLGNATSAVSFADVRATFLEAWEQVLTLHSNTLSTMDETDLKEIDMWRNGKLDSIPEYGNLEEKKILLNNLKVGIKQLSTELSQQANAESKAAKIEGVGQRETTRRIMLAQAESDVKQNIITESEYNKIVKLIGLQGSLFQQQLAALQTYGTNYESLFQQMDQTLAAARDEIKKTEGRETLAGGYFGRTSRSSNIDEIKRQTSHLGTAIGDGIRSSFPRPDTIGIGVPATRGDGTYYNGGIFEPWIGIPNHLEQNTTYPGVDPETIDPRVSNREGFTTGNPVAPSSRPGSPYERGARGDNLFGTKTDKVRNSLSSSRLTGVNQNGQLGNANFSPNKLGFALWETHGVDPTEHGFLSPMATIGVITVLAAIAAPRLLTAYGDMRDSVKTGKAKEIIAVRDDNPEGEVNLTNDDNSF